MAGQRKPNACGRCGGIRSAPVPERGSKRIGIDVKAAKEWRREFGSSLADLLAGGQLTRGVAVYGGTKRLKDRGITVLPFAEFVRELAAGRVLR